MPDCISSIIVGNACSASADWMRRFSFSAACSSSRFAASANRSMANSRPSAASTRRIGRGRMNPDSGIGALRVMLRQRADGPAARPSPVRHGAEARRRKPSPRPVPTRSRWRLAFSRRSIRQSTAPLRESRESSRIRFRFHRKFRLSEGRTKLMRGLMPDAPRYRRQSVLSDLIYCFKEGKVNGTTVALHR